MTNPSEVVADLRIAAEDARRFSAALFDRGYVRREGVRPFSELLERAADTIDHLTSSGEAVPKIHHIKDDAATRERIIREMEETTEPGVLNWTEYPNIYAPDAFPGPFWDARTPFGRYNIERVMQDPETGHPITGEWWFFVRFNTEAVGSRSTLDAAQLLAEVDYASRLGFAQAAFAASPREGHVEVPLFSKEAIEDFQFLAQMQVGIRDCIGLDREKLTIAKRLRDRGYVTIADSAQGPMVELTEAGAVKALERFEAKPCESGIEAALKAVVWDKPVRLFVTDYIEGDAVRVITAAIQAYLPFHPPAGLREAADNAMNAYVDALVKREHGGIAAAIFLAEIAVALGRHPTAEMDAKRAALQSNLRWTANFRWAMNAMRVRRVRHELTFSQRIAFDAELRPYVGSSRIAYPDAFYHITVGDIIRALRAAHGLPT